MNDICDIILWYVDPLLGTDRGISKYTAAIASEGVAIVVCRPVARHRPRNKQIYNGHCK
jgi:hypothetical protein